MKKHEKIIDVIQSTIVAVLLCMGLLFLGFGIGLFAGVSNTIDLIGNSYQLNITYDSMNKQDSNIFLVNVFIQYLAAISNMFLGIMFILIAALVDSNKIIKKDKWEKWET